ncbi:MAG: hypothetical protein ABIQ98_05565 [Sphingomicrobium sp.]
MSDGPIWFAPKRYGWGAGPPISWQGWLVTIVFLVIAVGAALRFADRPIVLAAILVPATIILLIVTAKTTRGGWRWRWGGDA